MMKFYQENKKNHLQKTNLSNNLFTFKSVLSLKWDFKHKNVNFMKYLLASVIAHLALSSLGAQDLEVAVQNRTVPAEEPYGYIFYTKQDDDKEDKKQFIENLVQRVYYKNGRVTVNLGVLKF